MNIFLTYDYELFFGKHAGSVEKCMLEPTEKLFGLAESRNVNYTFFVDVGYLIEAEKYEQLSDEVDKVKAQIREMIERRHDVQLHIHPHWEKSKWVDGNWKFATRLHYKLSDYTREESAVLIRKYKNYLENLIGRTVTTFRAGGWCIQPFEHIRDVFKEIGIRYDSTVIPGDYLQTDAYAVDFRFAPLKSKYRFEYNPLIEDENGYFTEYPIGSLRYGPLFYWRLYGLGKLFPSRHKMVGDGIFLSQGGRKKRVLFSYTDGHISSDGYFAGKMEAGLNKHENLGFEDLVIIGHPKGCTEYSFKKLDQFILRHHKNHRFISFHDIQ